jgi:hypothetical protein
MFCVDDLTLAARSCSSEASLLWIVIRKDFQREQQTERHWAVLVTYPARQWSKRELSDLLIRRPPGHRVRTSLDADGFPLRDCLKRSSGRKGVKTMVKFLGNKRPQKPAE